MLQKPLELRTSANTKKKKQNRIIKTLKPFIDDFIFDKCTPSIQLLLRSSRILEGSMAVGAVCDGSRVVATAIELSRHERIRFFFAFFDILNALLLHFLRSRLNVYSPSVFMDAVCKQYYVKDSIHVPISPLCVTPRSSGGTPASPCDPHSSHEFLVHTPCAICMPLVQQLHQSSMRGPFCCFAVTFHVSTTEVETATAVMPFSVCALLGNTPTFVGG